MEPLLAFPTLEHLQVPPVQSRSGPLTRSIHTVFILTTTQNSLAEKPQPFHNNATEISVCYVHNFSDWMVLLSGATAIAVTLLLICPMLRVPLQCIRVIGQHLLHGHQGLRYGSLLKSAPFLLRVKTHTWSI